MPAKIAANMIQVLVSSKS